MNAMISVGVGFGLSKMSPAMSANLTCRSAAAWQPATFGEKPETDLEIPRGPHKGKMLSELVRTERKYVEETILKSSNPSWGMCAEAWLKHVYGEGGGDDIDFG